MAPYSCMATKRPHSTLWRQKPRLAFSAVPQTGMGFRAGFSAADECERERSTGNCSVACAFLSCAWSVWSSCTWDNVWLGMSQGSSLSAPQNVCLVSSRVAPPRSSMDRVFVFLNTSVTAGKCRDSVWGTEDICRVNIECMQTLESTCQGLGSIAMALGDEGGSRVTHYKKWGLWNLLVRRGSVLTWALTE